MPYKYKAFISYSWADRRWGEWLHRTLETYRTPKALIGKETARGPVPARLHPIFKDREEEAAGSSIGASIEAAMRESEFLIVLCSPRSAQSKWVNREVAWFKANRERENVLALVIDGEPMASSLPGREVEECFPKSLLMKVGPDLQPTDEAEDAPLAADARPEGDGKRGAILKLAAAMLGLGLDDLVRRDDRRRQARRRLVTGASLGLAAAMAFLAFDATRARIAADKARGVAVAAQGLAEAERGKAVKARDDAEGIIELILTDLKSDLEGYGTLKSVTAIGNRAIGYYEGQDVKRLTPDQLGRRARVLLMLGEADNKRGDLKAALARYETAAATTSEQLARDPGNAQRIFDHAQSVFWVGYIAWQRGDADRAKLQFTEYYALATRLVANDPGNDDWRAELKYALNNLGTLALDEGDAAAAEAYFGKSLDLALSRLVKSPEDADRVRAAGQAYAWLADARSRLLKFKDALATREEELKLYSPHLLREPPIVTLVSAAAVAEHSSAQIHLALGDIEAALLHSQRALARTEKLIAFDGSRSEFQERNAMALVVYGEALLHAKRIEEARQAIDACVRVAQSLSDRDRNVVIWRGNVLAQARLIQAKIRSLEGADRFSVAEIDSLIEEIAPLAAAAKAAPQTKRILCQALAMRAKILNEQSAWNEAARRCGNLQRDQHADGLAVLAETLAHSGDRQEAMRIAARLVSAGYRHPDFVAVNEELRLANLTDVTQSKD